MPSRRASLAVAVLAAAVVGVPLVVMQPANGAGLLDYENLETVALGRTIYDETCASCHGANLEGQPDWRTRDAEGYLPAPPHDETGHTWHHPDAQLIELTARGVEAVVGGGYRSRMPAYGDTLTEDEILAVLSYIKSTWPARVIDTHNEINESQGN